MAVALHALHEATSSDDFDLVVVAPGAPGVLLPPQAASATLTSASSSGLKGCVFIVLS
jgi:hypothetical protein